VTPDLAQAFKLADTTGALVGGVQPNAPAEAAGIKEGDVIIELEGKKVTDPRHLRLTISQTPPKTKVSIKVIRDGKEKNFTVTLGALPEEMGGNPGDNPTVAPDSKAEQLDGVEVGDLDEQARQHYGIPDRIKGALVSRVDPDSKAAEAELREGDVIVEINRQPVASAEQAVELSNKAKGDRVLLRVYSVANGLGVTRYLSVEAAKKK
jgi:serine protease Do